jgi:hypothetical protein
MSTEDEEMEESTTFTWVNFKFKTIRIVDNVFTSHVNTIKAEVVMEEDATEKDINVTLDKIHFWFDQVLSNSILFNRENIYALSIMFDENGAAFTENFPMIFPDEPSDDNLVRVLHSKMNAFGAGKVVFGMLELTSDTREMLTCTFTGYGEWELPDMAEWVGERAYHDKPWWARDDGSTLDAIPTEDADLTKVPTLGVDMNFIDARYKRSGDDTAIIVRPQFKPEVISGGKGTDDKPKD